MAARRGGSAIFASYNIHKCVGVDRRFDPDRVMAVIGEIGPDVIALQEADRRFGDRAGLLDLPRLRARRPASCRCRSRTGIAGTAGTATSCSCARARCSGLHQIALPGLEPRGALVVDIDLAAGPVRVVAAHLGLFRHSRLLQVEALLAHAGEGTGRPVVLMGDLNEWRRRAALGAEPASSPASGRSAACASFPAYFPVLALDRVLAQPPAILERLEAHESALARLASDHLPVKAVIRLDGTEQAAAAAPFPARPRRRLLARLLADDRPAP